MARGLVACSKDDNILNGILSIIDKMNRRLTPDHVLENQPLIHRNDHTLSVVFNPPADLDWHEGSFVLGKMIPSLDSWWRPGTPIPDGSYALFRKDSDSVQLISDVVGSRTIWYYLDRDIFLASNSQRAILAITGNFSLNPDAVPWMISSGCPGPGMAWDKRIKMLPPDSNLVLDIDKWQVSISSQRVEFEVENRSVDEHKRLLKQSMCETFDSLKLDYDRWLLPLSGGYDSRAILLSLPDRSGLKCITWGVKESLKDSRNDAYIARQLAQEAGADFHFFQIEAGDEPLVRIFDRFIEAGEGRIDHVSGYMDGLKIWQHLYQQKTSGVIRGDEGFGWTSVYTPGDVRRYTGLVEMKDHRNLKTSETYGIAEQAVPESLARRQNESLAVWRDRIYHQFRIPVILSALNEIKGAYVEVINPLLSRKIIERVRRLPDNLRTEKTLFKSIVCELTPQLDFAENPAIVPAVNYLDSRTATDLFKGGIEDIRERNILPDSFLNWVLSGMKVSDREFNERSKRTIKEWIPETLRPIVKSIYGKQNISLNRLAFRIYIIARMQKIIEEDILAVNA